MALAVAALSCDVSTFMPAQEALPTGVPGGLETVVAGTAQAAQTQTAQLLPPSATPSPTPTVTRTPTLTPTASPTFIFLLKSPVPPSTATPTGGTTSSGSGGYACRLTSQNPEDGTEYNPNASFDMVWNIQNTGGTTWVSSDVDFTYVSGRKMHDKDTYDLPKDVAPNSSVTMTVGMRAPKVTGSWKTVWTLRRGSNDFCHVDVTIVVQ